MLYYFGILPREEKQQKWDLVHSKLEGIIFYIKFLLDKIFKDQDSSKFTVGLDSVEYSILFKIKFIM